jgi:hypothetical protein
VPERKRIIGLPETRKVSSSPQKQLRAFGEYVLSLFVKESK